MKMKHLVAVLLGLAALSLFTADASAMYNPATGTFLQRDPGPSGMMATPSVDTARPTTGGGFLPRDQVGASSPNLWQPDTSEPATLGVMHAELRIPDSEGKTEALAIRMVARLPHAEHFTGTTIAPVLWIHAPHLEYADGMNLYQYAGSSPPNRVDPTGLESGDTCKKDKAEKMGSRATCPEGSFKVTGGKHTDYGSGIGEDTTEPWCIWCTGCCVKESEKCKGTTQTIKATGSTTLYIPTCACQ